MVLGDFNAKNKICFGQNDTIYKGSILNELMAPSGLTEIILEAAHTLESSVSCIELAFTSQENLIWEFI